MSCSREILDRIIERKYNLVYYRDVLFNCTTIASSPNCLIIKILMNENYIIGLKMEQRITTELGSILWNFASYGT